MSSHPDQTNAHRLAGRTAGAPTQPPAGTGDGTLGEDPATRAPLVLNNRSFKDITDIICGYVENKPPQWWLPLFMLVSSIAGLGGPTKTTPSASSAAAKFMFSLRKP